MNYKRAVVFAAGLYVASFIVGVVVTLFIGPEFLDEGGVSSPFLVLQALLALLLGFASSWFYFNSPSTTPSAMNGLMFGGIAVLVGFVFDFLLFIPGMLAGYLLTDLLSFYAEVWFWIALILVLASTSAAGFLRARTTGGV